MDSIGLKAKMKKQVPLLGTFVRTPSIEIVEILAVSDLDFVILDAEHFPFDRSRIDSCLALGKALNFPILVRVPNSSHSEILKVLDAGAIGIVVPHVDSVPKAKEIVKAAHYGSGGRGYAGGTRSSGRLSRPMSEVIEEAKKRTIVIAQIEEASGVNSIDEIAAVDGLDAVFLGPSDLSLSYGQTDLESHFLVDAMVKVGEAAKKNKINYITFITDMIKINDWKKFGFTTYVLGSEHAWIVKGSQKAAKDFKELC
tara:strand:+ start:1036 stop:1800 length:765 start_codon:yes stop_codon:yes gene_type:complete